MRGTAGRASGAARAGSLREGAFFGRAELTSVALAGATAAGERDISNAKAMDPNIVKEFAGYGLN